MKIGLVNDYPPATGIGNYAFSLFSELKEMEKDVDMLYLQYKEPLEVLDEHIKVIETPFKLPMLSKTLNWSYYFPKRIPQGYDIYHVSSQYLSKVAKYRKPCVVTCLDLAPLITSGYPLPLRFMLRRALKYLKEAKIVITVSESSKKDIMKYCGVHDSKIRVIPYGISDRFKQRSREKAREVLSLPLDKQIVLHVGSEEPRKNVLMLIKSFYEVQKKIEDVILVRVGEKRRETINLITELQLNKKFIHACSISKEQIPYFYNAADVLVFPSIYEGFGLPPLEAMASGTPVITSNISSLPEVVGDSGIMVDPFDVNGLAKVIHDVLTDENLHHKMIKSGLKRAKMFSWRKIANETSKIYEEVVR